MNEKFEIEQISRSSEEEEKRKMLPYEKERSLQCDKSDLKHGEI